MTAINWVYAQWVLAIWNPDMMNFIQNDRRRRSLRLRYKTMGIVCHDRELNMQLTQRGAA